MMHRRVIVWCLIAGLGIATAWATELAGVTMPDRVTVGDETLELNGMGLRKKLWVKVYVAGLYLGVPAGNAEAALAAPGTKRVVMHFLTDKVTEKKLDNAWFEGFRANSPTGWDELEPRVRRFAGLFGDMKVGDVIELTMIPGEGTRVVLNGEEAAVIEGVDFATALLKVWLGEHPPTEDLKAGMLGG